MKLVTFTAANQTRIGAVVGDYVVDSLGCADIPVTMLDFLAAGELAMAAMQRHIDSGTQRLSLSSVQLLAPIPRPGKFLGVGLNYPEHIAETGWEKPAFPTIFTKQGTCVVGHGAPIYRPSCSDKIDYEGELAFVVGRRCKQVALADAKSMIAGYTIVNDVTMRDWQARSPTWTLGKSFDSHGPMGPWLVTADEVPDPHNLSLKTWVDDSLRQQANTGEMIFNCFELLAYLSQAMTLEPGDVITTGTPSGVGVKMKPRGYLLPGQTVNIQIEGIGQLSNPVLAEPINP